MSDRIRELNPFFALVIVIGVAFVATALLDVTSLVLVDRPASGDTRQAADSPVMRFFNQHGEWLMVWEGAALAVVAVLAMGLDRWRSRHPEGTNRQNHERNQHDPNAQT